MILSQPPAAPGAPVRLVINAPMTLRTAHELLISGAPFFADGKDKIIDLAAVAQVDSSGLAVLLEWQALCKAAGGVLFLSRMPQNLRALADLYDLNLFQEVP
jgi:ABC-type transporter Mla MlaB component